MKRELNGVEGNACVSAGAQRSVSIYNSGARASIPDAAAQEGRLRPRSELHPDDTGNLGSQDRPPTSHPRAEQEPQEFLRATVWTRRPLADKAPIDHRLTVTARVPGSVPHTSAPVFFGRRHGRERAQMHGCEIYDVKISFIWAQSATLL